MIGSSVDFVRVIARLPAEDGLYPFLEEFQELRPVAAKVRADGICTRRPRASEGHSVASSGCAF